MTTLLQDLRYGLRLFAKNPGLMVVAVLSLALGIGANSTVFSIVDTLFLRPWPVKDPGHLVGIVTESPKAPEFRITSYLDYLDIRHEVGAFSDVVAYGDRGGVISGQGQGREIEVEVVSENFFSALGVRPLLGRAFSPPQDKAAPDDHTVVVSYALWQRYFGGDAAVPGKTTLLDGKEFTVIGVAPQDFYGLRSSSAPGIWVTLGGWLNMVPVERQYYARRDNRWFELAGYLRPGSQIAEARGQLQTLAKRIALASPSTSRDVTFNAYEMTVADAGGRRLGIYLMSMVGLVLLISCANVANLLLAQTERRQREIAMRRALGAGERRLVGQLLSEGLLLSSAGGVLGLVLAAWLMHLVPALVPGLSEIALRLDGRALVFTAAISLLTTLTFGLAPGWSAAKVNLVTTIKGEGLEWRGARGRLPLRSLLVAGEIALSVVLLAGSTLLLRSLLYSQGIHRGFDLRKNVLMLSVAPPPLYGYDELQTLALYSALASRVESIPGVARASYARRPPLTDSEGGETAAVVIPGVQPPPGADHFNIRFNVAAPKFFATVGTRVLRGREFDAFDLSSPEKAVIINDTMARRFWPNADPVGRTIQIDKQDRQVVGVVEAGRYVDLHESVQPYLFFPFSKDFSYECILFVETVGEPGALASTILKETTSVAQHLPIVNAVTFREYSGEILAGERWMAALLTGLSILGMFLAAVGLYASIAYFVTRRTHEVGIRMALGARRADVLRLVLAQGLRLSGAGAVVGLAGALAASRLMSRFIYGVAPTDPLSYAASILIAVAVALVASYFPARRATKVDPMVALRYE